MRKSKSGGAGYLGRRKLKPVAARPEIVNVRREVLILAMAIKGARLTDQQLEARVVELARQIEPSLKPARGFDEEDE